MKLVRSVMVSLIMFRLLLFWGFILSSSLLVIVLVPGLVLGGSLVVLVFFHQVSVFVCLPFGCFFVPLVTYSLIGSALLSAS